MDWAAAWEVLDALAAAGCPAWAGGGWGVDALIGRQTRPHRDLDLAVDAGHEQAALAEVRRLGYAVSTDWRPVRVELTRGEDHVDLHPVAFDPAGNGRQAGPDGTVFDYPADCFVVGTLHGRPVPCLSVDQQIRFHTGYRPREVDLHDLALLRAIRTAP